VLQGALFTQMPAIGFYSRQFLIAMLYAWAGGIGAMIFSLGRRLMPGYLFGAGMIGCGLGYFLSAISRRVLLNLLSSLVLRFAPPGWVMEIALVLEYALWGAIFGAFLGLTFKSSLMVLSLGLAGAIGFGLGHILGPSPKSLTQIIVWLPIRINNTILYGLLQAVYSAIIGILGGTLLGWVISREPEISRSHIGEKVVFE
jgi:hypothetical protein